MKLKKADGPVEPRISIYDAISPLDFRYYSRNERVFSELQPYLSETAMIRYMAKIEAALTRVLARKGICSKKAADEVDRAARMVTADEVYREEDILKHNVRALVNCMKRHVSDEAKPFIHFTATSHDIVASADALRYKEFTENALIKKMKALEKTLIEISLKYKDTVQVGRTHGQHAVPITFGFAVAQYVSRFGRSVVQVRKAGANLRGKVAGAVGSYNASALFFDDPEKLEEEVLAEIGLKASPISTQIPQHEYLVDYVHAVIAAFGVLANISDDMRHLQRSEIGEIGEVFDKKQVGSSTMPQKRNPINFENVKSMWKEFMPRMIALYSDQISEHQRDLTNSASIRFVAEILAGFYLSVDRLDRTLKKISVDENNLKKNFDLNKDLIVAEPLYILLAAYGHPDAHEAVKQLTLRAQSTKKTMKELLKREKNLEKYIKRFTKRQKWILENPERYTGIASLKAKKVCEFWKKELKI
ncbi:adenylosuccinate lyase [Candidatus Woesearchaeota archaeon]|nr:adenylosuccinate lyase [Candidatus Woesearchaeota archaeon]